MPIHHITSSNQTVFNVLNINIPRGKHINNPVTIFTCNQRHKLRMREHTWQHGGYFEQTSYTEKRQTTINKCPLPTPSTSTHRTSTLNRPDPAPPEDELPKMCVALNRKPSCVRVVLVYPRKTLESFRSGDARVVPCEVDRNRRLVSHMTVTGLTLTLIPTLTLTPALLP